MKAVIDKLVQQYRALEPADQAEFMRIVGLAGYEEIVLSGHLEPAKYPGITDAEIDDLDDHIEPAGPDILQAIGHN